MSLNFDFKKRALLTILLKPKIKGFCLNSLNISKIKTANFSQFVPACEEVAEDKLHKLQDFVDNSNKLFILTGAGISTESGIPDYRSEGVGLYATSSNRPVQYADFLKYPNIRQRYWARNFVGWPKFSSYLPNTSHYILSQWEKLGRVNWLVTQNVDALHYKAGSRNVTELHGSAHRVMCLSCPSKISRNDMQKLITDDNPNWRAEVVSVAPDGDVHLDSQIVKEFKVPECPSCGGTLKPEITFFGDNVPKEKVHFTLEKLFASDGVMVIGSSLETYSGYRFISRASENGMKIAIVNIGDTRGDKHAAIKIHGRSGDVLSRLVV